MPETIPDPDRLRFGLPPPPEVTTAWGARWIITPGGHIDQVHDRTDAVGPDPRRHQLLRHLNDHVGDQPAQRAAELLRSGQLGPADEHTVCLFDDGTVTVHASPRGSHGYLYVAAYFTADLPQQPHPCDPAT